MDKIDSHLAFHNKHSTFTQHNLAFGVELNWSSDTQRILYRQMTAYRLEHPLYLSLSLLNPSLRAVCPYT
jgi:hypothetical protein